METKKIVDVERFVFFDNSLSMHCSYVGGNSFNGHVEPTFLQLNADRFCRDMFDAVDNWDASIAGDDAVQAEKSKLLLIRSAGTFRGGVMFS